MRPSDSEKIRVGNALMFFSCAVLRLALHWQLPFTMENPARSRIWLCPSVKWLLKRRNVSFETVHYCAFGTRWKKPTSFLGTHLDLSVLSRFQCHSSRRGICQFSHKPHLPLMGQNDHMVHQAGRALSQSVDQSRCRGLQQHRALSAFDGMSKPLVRFFL